MKRRICIGRSDFRRLRQDGCLFIDKSLFIKEIIDSGADVLLIPRPRRFGKTLNLTMLRYFFEHHNDETRRSETEALFHGLDIKDTPEFEEHFGKYPVIFLTFKDVKEMDFESVLAALKRLIRKEIARQEEMLPNGQKFREEPAEILGKKADTGLYRESLQSLSEMLHKKHGTPPVILIDEYDTPIHASWQYGYYEEMISFMRGLLSGAFKDNPHIFKGVVSGILRVAKENIFSGINNLDTYTILDEPFSDKFGITEEELRALFHEYGMKEKFQEADSWYNGYRFGFRTIFNPWSILNFVNRYPSSPQAYWANTSSNDLIKRLVIEGGTDVRENIEKLIKGESIDSVIDQNIVFTELEKDDAYIYSLFFFSGYLKCARSWYQEEELHCSLSLPNREVHHIFKNIISKWLKESFGNKKLTTMLNALVTGNLDQFQRLLNEFVITTLSFFDAKGKNPEAVYQAFVLGMLLNLGQEYEISSNRSTNYR